MKKYFISIFLFSIFSQAQANTNTCLNAIFASDRSVAELESNSVAFRAVAHRKHFYFLAENGLTADVSFKILQSDNEEHTAWQCKDIIRERSGEPEKAWDQATDRRTQKAEEQPHLRANYYLLLAGDFYRVSCSVGDRPFMSGYSGTHPIETCSLEDIEESAIPRGFVASRCERKGGGTGVALAFMDRALRHRKNLIERCDAFCDMQFLANTQQRMLDACEDIVRERRHTADALSDLTKLINRKIGSHNRHHSDEIDPIN